MSAYFQLAVAPAASTETNISNCLPPVYSGAMFLTSIILGVFGEKAISVRLENFRVDTSRVRGHFARYRSLSITCEEAIVSGQKRQVGNAFDSATPCSLPQPALRCTGRYSDTCSRPSRGDIRGKEHQIGGVTRVSVASPGVFSHTTSRSGSGTTCLFMTSFRILYSKLRTRATGILFSNLNFRVSYTIYGLCSESSAVECHHR